MTDDGLGIRTAALVSVMLSASMFVVYTTANATSPTRNTANVREGAREQVLSVITTALANSDFSKARQMVQKLPDENSRKQLRDTIKAAEQSHFFQKLTSAVRTAQFQQGRSAASNISDKRLRDEFLQMIDFAEGRHALSNGDASTAASLAQKLQPGLKRALLRTGIAAEQHAAHNRESSLVSLRLALRDIPQVAPKHRRLLLVLIARGLLPMDLNNGLAVLDRALHEPPSEIAASGPAAIGIAGSAFYETIRAGNGRHTFSLSVPRLQGNLQELLLAYHGRIQCTHARATTPS